MQCSRKYTKKNHQYTHILYILSPWHSIDIFSPAPYLTSDMSQKFTGFRFPDIHIFLSRLLKVSKRICEKIHHLKVTVCVLWELTKTLFKQLYTFLTTVLHWSIVKDLKFEGLWDSVLNVVDDSVTDTEKVGSLKLLNNHSQSCFIVLLLFIKSFSDIFKYQAGIKLPSEHLAEPFVGS